MTPDSEAMIPPADKGNDAACVAPAVSATVYYAALA